jgi:hypothetical protein
VRMQITFKGGAQVEVDAGEWTTARNQITGELTKMDWTTPGGWTAKLHTINLGEVVAIVALRTPEEVSVDGN